MNARRTNNRVAELLTVLQLGLCGRCGRARYETRRTARHAARIAAPGTRLRAYRCGTAWHLTSPTGHRQHITPPVTLPPVPGRMRVGLDGRDRDERRYRRPGPGESARFQHLVDAPVHRGGPDPLVDARGTDPARSRARRAGGGR